MRQVNNKVIISETTTLGDCHARNYAKNENRILHIQKGIVVRVRQQIKKRDRWMDGWRDGQTDRRPDRQRTKGPPSVGMLCRIKNLNSNTDLWCYVMRFMLACRGSTSPW